MRRITTLLLVSLLLVGLAAVPASADRPIRGDIPDQEFVGCDTPDGRLLTFTGPIDFDDDRYFITFFRAGEPKFVGNAYHFSEDWEISAEPINTDECTPASEVVLSGYDRGVISVANMHTTANGQVEAVNPEYDPYARFGECLVGRNVHWSDPDGTFRITNC